MGEPGGAETFSCEPLYGVYCRGAVVLVHVLANVTCDAAAAKLQDFGKPGAKLSVAFRFSYFLKIPQI